MGQLELWPEAQPHGEVMIELKLAGNHLDRKAVERALPLSFRCAHALHEDLLVEVDRWCGFTRELVPCPATGLGRIDPMPRSWPSWWRGAAQHRRRQAVARLGQTFRGAVV